MNQQVAGSAMGKERKVNQPGPLQSNRGRVLFADDDPHVLRATGGVLEAAGFEVTRVTSGAAAHELLLSEEFDALLLDLQMPGNRDLELLRAATADRPFVPGVVLTGHPCLASAIGSMRLGIVDYLIKPASLNELFERLDSAIHRGRVLRSIQDAERMSEDLARLMFTLKEAVGQGNGGHVAGASQDPLRHLKPEELKSLSPREHQVLIELAQGNRIQKVAELLSLSPNTVRNHLKSIFAKLGVNSQVALMGKLAGAQAQQTSRAS